MSAVAVPSKGLVRTVLRLHRTALIVWTAFVVACVGYLVWLTQVTAGSVRDTLDACPKNGGFCGIDSLRDYTEPMGWISTFFYYGFWAVAAWAGGALIGRELESGTARLAWTQNVTPTRWLAVKLALPALALLLGGALFVPVFRWAWGAHRDLMGDAWTFPDVFAVRGPTVVAYGLCALAVGTLTALLVRRSLPALGISVAVMIVLNQYLEKRRGGMEQPASRFWPLQLTETGILLAVAAIATTTAFLLLRRRTD